MHAHCSLTALLGRAVLLGLLATLGLPVPDGLRAADSADSIDWNRARAMRQKQQQGISLDAAERAYLERAMEARQAATGGERTSGRAVLDALSPQECEQARELMRKREAGEPLTGKERALAEKLRPGSTQKQDATGRAKPVAAASASETAAAVPLTQMTAGERYKGGEGGLYGEGRNEPPPSHLRAALAAASEVRPRDPSGEPSANGKVVLLSVGMSNTTQEFSRFKELANSDAAKSKQVLIVDGAQGGQAAAEWAESPEGRVWQTVESRLKQAGATAAQVQVAWIKQADKRPTEPFPVHTKTLETNLEKIVQMLKTKFPNLRLVYLSSRTYGGYAATPLNPEPYAFEGAFAVRDLVRRQIAGDAALTFDSAKGPVRAPVLLWGPYLWANGETPRADGFAWKREDFAADGTHPAASGREKVAQLLLSFLKTDPTARPWFVAHGVKSNQEN